MTLRIEVDVLPGSDIDTAASELVALANRFGVLVASTFNGVKLLVSPAGDPAALVENWRAALASDLKFKMANARPAAGTPTHD